MSKKPNIGGERLFEKSEWCDPSLLKGSDLDMIHSRVLDIAFRRMLEQFKPNHDVALMGLCTSTRPYSRTRTWSEFVRLSEGFADPIVTSNGGIVPIEFESEWPFLTYDAPGSKEHDRQYISHLGKRLVSFFEVHKYERVVFVYMPKKRNRIAARYACEKIGIEFSISPSPDTWKKMVAPALSNRGARTTKYIADGYMWNPLAHPFCIDEVSRRLNCPSTE